MTRERALLGALGAAIPAVLPPLSCPPPQGSPSAIPPSFLSFLSPSPSWSLPVPPSLCLLHFSNFDHFPGRLLPSSPSADERALPPPLSLCFLTFLLFPSYNREQMSLLLWIFPAPPAASELRFLSYSAWACLGSFISCPLAPSLPPQCPHLHLHSSSSLAPLTPPPGSPALRVSLPPSDGGADGAEPGSFCAWCRSSVPQHPPTRVS